MGADLNKVQYWADRYVEHFAGYAEDWAPDEIPPEEPWRIEQPCTVCGETYIRDRPTSLYCSHQCQAAASTARAKRDYLQHYPTWKAEYDSGDSIATIAGRHGVPLQGVYKTLKYFGFEPRSNTQKAREVANNGVGSRGGGSSESYKYAKKRGYWRLPQGESLPN